MSDIPGEPTERTELGQAHEWLVSREASREELRLTAAYWEALAENANRERDEAQAALGGAREEAVQEYVRSGAASDGWMTVAQVRRALEQVEAGHAAELAAARKEVANVLALLDLARDNYTAVEAERDDALDECRTLENRLSRARELGHEPVAAPSAATGQESAAWSEVELRRELAAWQASYAMLNEELTATRNARDLAVEAFEGVNMKLAEARRVLANAPRITDNGRGVPTYYLWEPNGTRVQLVTLGLVETLVKLRQGITGTPVEQEPPNGTVVVDAAHIAWQRRDADAFAVPEDCWFQVGQEDGDPWTSVLAAGPAVVVWRPRPIEYDHAHVTTSQSTGRALCTDCGTSADTAEELATVPCETGEVRAARIEGILEETQASQPEALELLRAEDEGDQ